MLAAYAQRSRYQDCLGSVIGDAAVDAGRAETTEQESITRERTVVLQKSERFEVAFVPISDEEALNPTRFCDPFVTSCPGITCNKLSRDGLNVTGFDETLGNERFQLAIPSEALVALVDLLLATL